MLEAQQSISEPELEAGLRGVVADAAFANTTAALTTGAILTAFALHLGATNAEIGLLAAIPFLSQLAQAPAIGLVERLRQRKRIAVLSSILGRAMLGVMALLPFAGQGAITGLIGATIILCTFAAIGGCAWNSWMRDLVPEERMGRIFARRSLWASVTTAVAGIGGAMVLEFAPPGTDARHYAFAALYGIGCLSGFISILIVSRIPEPVLMPAPRGSESIVALLREPLADANFARLLLFLGSWQFAVNLATPFFTVFLVQQLGYSMTVVMTLSVTSQVANVFALRSWGALADRFTNKSVLLVAAPAYILCITGMIGASQIDTDALRLGWLAVLHLLMGASVAGVTLATTNISLKLSPRGQAASYVAASAMATALAAGSAPIIGGLFADFFAGRRFELIIRWTDPDGVFSFLPMRLGNWDFYFLLSGILGLYALHRLAQVREEGEIGRRQMVRHILIRARSSVHNVSTVTGLRALTEMPGNILRELRVRRRYLRMALARDEA